MPLRTLVTAPPGTGKTTLCTKVAKELARIGCDVTGFLCRERRDSKGRRAGFDLCSLDGSKRAPLASVDGPTSGYMVGKYHVQVDSLEAFTLPLLDSALNARCSGPRVFIFDEIGKMELYSSLFVSRVRQLLGSPDEDLHVLGTVALYGGGFIAESKRTRGVEIVEIDVASRDEAARNISGRFEAVGALRSGSSPALRQSDEDSADRATRRAPGRRRWQVKSSSATKESADGEADASKAGPLDDGCAAFGKGVYGQLGYDTMIEGCGDLKHVMVAAREITDASLGFDHSAVIADGGLFLFGKNHRGQCAQRCSGKRDEKSAADPNEDVAVPRSAQGLPAGLLVKSVACGGAHTLALLENGQVWSCGDNSNGQCGLGAGTQKCVNSFRALDSLSFAESIASGFKHSAAVSSNKLYMWGGCGQGQLGLGSRRDVPLPTQLDVGAPVRQVSLGRWHSIVLTKKSQVFSFGWGRFGVLGQGDVTDHHHPVQIEGLAGQGEVHYLAAGAVHNGAIVGEKRRLFVWGRGSLGRLGLGSEANALRPSMHQSIENVEHLAMGGDFGVALSGGEWLVWGKNEEGQLGLGDSDRQNRARPTKNPSLRSFHRVVVGDCHTVAFRIQSAEQPEAARQVAFTETVAAESEDSEAAKRRRRAERFGIPFRP